jgi:phenylpyruvate tautomerase PptA (4-oxalocrotonate tautomerase family)
VIHQQKGQELMPQFFIEAPLGLGQTAKEKLMKDVTEAIDEAYHLPDVRVWLREYPGENVSQDGRILAEPVRPVCFLEAPELASIDSRRTMAEKINTAIDTAYGDLANTKDTLVLMNHYPLENAGWAGRLQSDNPQIVDALRRLNG